MEKEVALALAPMEGVSDLPMRFWFSLVSKPKQMSTPFLRATATYPNGYLPISYAPECNVLRDYVPYDLVPQVMACDADDALRVADMVLEDSPFIDLNCGCPSPKVYSHGAGSSLLVDPDRFSRMVEKILSRVGSKRLSVKMRTGIKSDEEFPGLISAIRTMDLRQLGIHGRTRADRYTGSARWNLMQRAAQEVAAPVVGSGDIKSWRCLASARAQTPGVEKWIIGRGALRNPWIFWEIARRDNVMVHPQSSMSALKVCHDLHLLYFEEPEALLTLAKSGFLLRASPRHHEEWKEVSLLLEDFIAKRNREVTPAATRRSLGRLKLVWNYLRSSLPERFFDPQVLRARSVADFFLILNEIGKGSSQPLALRYQPELDWIYAGEKKPQLN